MQGQLPARPAEHESAHRPLGFDHQGIETPQIQSEDRPSIAVALYVYGSNHPRAQCARDVAPGGLLASVYHLAKVQDDEEADQPEELCIKVSVSKKHPRIPSVFRVRKSADLQERESYDMLGIFHESHPRLKRISMPDTWIGRPLRKDHTVPDFYEPQDSLRIKKGAEYRLTLTTTANLTTHPSNSDSMEHSSNVIPLRRIESLSWWDVGRARRKGADSLNERA